MLSFWRNSSARREQGSQEETSLPAVPPLCLTQKLHLTEVRVNPDLRCFLPTKEVSFQMQTASHSAF